jgi:hypothetical protein
MKNALLRTALFACVVVSPLVDARAAELAQPAMREELLAMRERDQAVRQATTQEAMQQWDAIDAANLLRIKAIVAQYGWPTVTMVGKDGAQAAWLLAQHADRDAPFQNQVLAMMEPLVAQGEASGVHYAYLYDRTHYPQRYGTQGTCVNAQAWEPFEIEDLASVNARRRALGLMSMAEYARHFECDDPLIAFGHATRRTVPVPADDKPATP